MWPQGMTKIAGLLSPIVIGAASAGELLRQGEVVVSRNSAAAAANLVSSELLSRLAGLIRFLAPLSETAISSLFAIVLKQINVAVSVVDLACRLVPAGVHCGWVLIHLAPLYLLHPV